MESFRVQVWMNTIGFIALFLMLSSSIGTRMIVGIVAALALIILGEFAVFLKKEETRNE